MLSFLLRRLALVVPTFLGITLLAFSLVHLIPGDPVEAMVGQHQLDPAFHAQMLHQLGLDEPLPEQYLHYLWRALHLDLGRSFVSQAPVWSDFATLFPATVELALCAMTFAIVLGLLAGVLAAVRRGSALDHGVMAVSLAGYSMPIFWWGLLLIMFFSVALRDLAPALALPVSGRIALEYDVPARTGFMLVDAWLAPDPGAWRSAVSHLVLPTIVLGTVPLAVVARMTRSAMLEVLREDYVRTARAKGLSPARVVFVHALRNALGPVVTMVGLLTGSLLGGAVLTETLFSWPGVGKWLVDAVAQRDYPVIQGGILITATLVIAVNLAVDLLNAQLNPRIRHA
ncbi:MAG TPA: ABC transporter permease subunit [Burkholderiaceae bacterium]